MDWDFCSFKNLGGEQKVDQKAACWDVFVNENQVVNIPSNEIQRGCRADFHGATWDATNFLTKEFGDYLPGNEIKEVWAGERSLSKMWLEYGNHCPQQKCPER